MFAKYYESMRKLCALFNNTDTVSETEIIAAIGKHGLKRMKRRGVIESCMACNGVNIYALLPY